ncbi:unnamed protein product [Adineta ricciae]|uniref:Uncharacterized protein n=1 Tax=Adineta ricciae TaxID=249248 RepID=A0A816EB17_ADIRI|nr:unnamed protein product [Adineta ricciae]
MVVTNTPVVSPYKGTNYKSPCGRCALSYIFSSFLVEGVTSKQLPKDARQNFPENLKAYVQKEVGICQAKNLKKVKITKLDTLSGNNLIVEFVATVNPRYQHELNSAIRLVLLKLNVG